MFGKEYVEELGTATLESMSSTRAVILEFIRDKSVDVNTRWSIFTKFSKLLNENTKYDCDAFMEVFGPNISLYEDFNLQRYETVSYVDVAENIDDEIRCSEDKKSPFTEEKFILWKEKVLEAGYGCFTLDW